MFGLWRRRSGDAIGEMHTRIVAASRDPALYGPGGFPDTVEGRFESLTLHVLLVLRRLRRLPDPAGDAAQELIDAVFAHLEIALRETGVGDFGVPKRMKKLARAFYDRTSRYDPVLDRGDADALASEIATRLPQAEPDGLRHASRALLASERVIAAAEFGAILAGPPFAPVLHGAEPDIVR